MLEIESCLHDVRQQLALAFAEGTIQEASAMVTQADNFFSLTWCV